MILGQVFLTVLGQTPEIPCPRRLTNSYRRHLCGNADYRNPLLNPREGVSDPNRRSVNSTYENGKRQGTLRVYPELSAGTRMLAGIPEARFWGVGYRPPSGWSGIVFQDASFLCDLCVYWQFSIGSCRKPRCWWPRTARNSTSDRLNLLRFSRESPACCVVSTRQAGGTWLGINQHGLVVGACNRRRSIPGFPSRSRGVLCRELLKSESAVHARDVAMEELSKRQVRRCQLRLCRCRKWLDWSTAVTRLTRSSCTRG